MTDTRPATAPTPAPAPTLETVVDTYLAMFGDSDPGPSIAAAFVPDGHLVDPLLDVTGHEALAGAVAMFQEQYPGHRFERTSGIDLHHDLARFTWQIVDPDGAVFLAGSDVVALGDDGRITIAVGFFGDVPAKDAA